MKKLSLLFVLMASCTFIFAQGPKYFLDNSLPFKKTDNSNIAYPFVGGFISPQFSNIDLNADGVKDLFVFDRGDNSVMTFINTGSSGTGWRYDPNYEMGFPKMHSWALLADYNGDGKEDIFTAADPNLYSQSVAVYKNVSQGDKVKFELVVAQLTADQNIQGLPEAPIYWIRDDISAIDDVDGDGDLDILTFDASAASITLYGNIASENSYSLDSLAFRTYDECWGGFRESFLDRSITLGVPCFGARYYKAGAHAGSTMLLLDMDDDGDKELILGDASFDELSILYNGKNDFSWPYDSIRDYDTTFPLNTTSAKVYNFPAAYYVDANLGSASKDLIVAPNVSAGGKNTNQIWLYRNDGTNTKPDFKFQKTNFLQELTVDFGSGVTPRFIDVDGDEDLDLLLAHRGEFRSTFNRADRITLFKNTGDKTNASFTQDNTFDYLGLIKDSIRDMKPTFGDLNGDGKEDMLIGDAVGQLRYYQNNSTTGNLSFAAGVKNYMNIDVGNAAVPQIIDLDGDDLNDIVVGTAKGYINFFKNTGSKTSPNFSETPTIERLGKVYVADFYWYYVIDGNGVITDSLRVFSTTAFAAPFFSDLDKDGDLDLLVGSESGNLRLYTDITNINDSFIEVDTFVFNNLSKDFGGYNSGLRSVPEAATLSDSTNALDVIMLGNFRGGLKYLNAELDTTKNKDSTNTSVFVIFEELNVNVYPNPTSNDINIERSLQQYDGDLVVRVNDVLGREVFYGTLKAGISNYTFSFANQLSGIYYVTLTDNEQFRTVQRVSVIK